MRYRDDCLFSGMYIYLLNIDRQEILVFLVEKKNESHHLIFWSLKILTGLIDQVRG